MNNNENRYPLWEKEVPFFEPNINQEAPTLTYYAPEGNREGSVGCVIVLPGGGYCSLAVHEGQPIAEMYNKAGFAAFVLRYRVDPYRYPAIFADVHRAVRWVRYHAAEFNINPEKIAVLGFSAGGHLAMVACEHFDYGRTDGDEIDAVSSRPNAGILCYPVISLFSSNTHVGSRESLLGYEKNDVYMQERYSGEINVRLDMPSIFFWHTAEDNCVDVRNSLDMAAAMRKIGVPFEMHVFPYGGHGVGLGYENNPHASQWCQLSCNWLKLLEF